MTNPLPENYSIFKFATLGNPHLGPCEERRTVSLEGQAAYNKRFYPRRRRAVE